MALTTALALSCTDNSGGLKYIHLANRADVTNFTLTGKKYSAVTMVATKVFYKFQFAQDTAEMRENVTRENNSTKAVHEIEMYLPGLIETNRDAIEELIGSSACGMIAIVETTSGVKFVIGYSENFLTERPLRVKSDGSVTGKALSDASGSTIVLESMDNTKSRIFTGSVPV